MVVTAGEAKKPIKVYASAEERARIEELAAERNVSASEYLRCEGLGGKLKSRFDVEAVKELVKIGAGQGEAVEALNRLLNERSLPPGTLTERITALVTELERVEVEIAKVAEREARRL
jgi:hypothetical protein